MQYSVEGKMTPKEYYKLFIWDYRLFFIISIFISFHIGNEHIGYNRLFSTAFLREYWHVVLVNWLLIFLLIEFFLFLIVFVLAFTKRHKFLGMKKYTFTDESIHIQTEVSKSKIPWDRLVQVKNKRNYILVSFNNSEQLYLLDRFFEDEREKNEILSFIRKNQKGHS